jgi:hypothetical protein
MKPIFIKILDMDKEIHVVNAHQITRMYEDNQTTYVNLSNNYIIKTPLTATEIINAINDRDK